MLRPDQRRRLVELVDKLEAEGASPADVIHVLLTISAANATEPGDTCHTVVMCRDHFLRNAENAYDQMEGVEMRQRAVDKADAERWKNAS